ncbi:UNVERIFIED_CONTAM: hypothetical protein Sradi_7093500, partial [Sesamum radiatum]
LARLTNKIERAFLACLVKSSFGPTLAGDDDVELTAEKDSAFRRVVYVGFSTPRQNGSERKKKVTHEGLPVIYWRKVGMTSSPHGPYGLGHTRATMAITMGSKAVRRSESGKIASVRIVLCNSGT